MGKPPAVKEPGKPAPARWPFEPLQPGDHQPVRLADELEHAQKQSGAGGEQPTDKGSRR